jgi:hypothetical protein
MKHLHKRMSLKQLFETRGNDGVIDLMMILLDNNFKYYRYSVSIVLKVHSLSRDLLFSNIHKVIENMIIESQSTLKDQIVLKLS